MTAARPGVVAALTLALAGCAARAEQMIGRNTLPPPAREDRAGAPPQSAGPDPSGAAPGPALASASAPRSPAPQSAAPQSPAPPSAARQRAVDEASALVGRRHIVVDGVEYGDDCAALVRAALERAGRPVERGARDAAALYAASVRAGAIVAARRFAPGDLVFFADRAGGRAAHVAIVARVDADGTATVLHRTARGVLRLRVNVAHPDRRTDSAGRRLNDALVVGARSFPAGALVVAVADPWQAR